MSIFDETRPLITMMMDICGCTRHMDCPRVYFKNSRFAGEELILLEDTITTQERFEKWEASHCHVNYDGKIMCYGEQIGTTDDLVIFWPLQLTE